MGKTGAMGLAILLAAATSAAAQSGLRPAVAASLASAAQAGPAGYWKGDDGFPTPGGALDSSGNGNSGTYANGATTSQTVPTLQFTNPTSFSFNGTGANVSIPGFTWPAGGPVTVAFWNNVTTAQVQNSSAFTVGNTNTPSRFHVHAPWGDSTLYWDYGDTGTGRISTSYTAYLNKWTHVALVSEGNGGAFKAIYLDGVLKASATSSDGPDVALTGLFIGSWPGVSLHHRGLMDDFRIYNSVLTAAEIQLLASGAGGPAAPTGLQATPAIGQIQLQWNAVTGATGYNLKRTAAGSSTPTIITLTGTTYTDGAGLSPGWPYTYVVSAFNAVGEGPDSSPGVTSSPLSPPPRTQKLGSDESCSCGTIPAGGPGAGWLAALAAALIAVIGPRRSRT